MRDQWAGLFTEFLARRADQKSITALSHQLGDLKAITDGLREYTETILERVAADKAPKIISEQARRLRHRDILMFSRHPMIDYFHRRLEKRIPIRLKELKFFLAAHKIEDYLRAIGLSKKQIDEQMDKVGRQARRDFVELKRQLLGKEESLEIEEEEEEQQQQREVRATKKSRVQRDN